LAGKQRHESLQNQSGKENQQVKKSTLGKYYLQTQRNKNTEFDKEK